MAVQSDAALCAIAAAAVVLLSGAGCAYCGGGGAAGFGYVVWEYMLADRLRTYCGRSQQDAGIWNCDRSGNCCSVQVHQPLTRLYSLLSTVLCLHSYAFYNTPATVSRLLLVL